MFTAPETSAFAIATYLLVFIAVIEGIAMCVGASMSEWLEHYLPDHGHVDGVFEKALGWLYVGRVPMLALLALFFGCFACAGFGLNLLSQHLLGVWLTPVIAVPLAFFASLPVVRVCAALLARLIPKDQTFAVGFDSLIGRAATIVTGTARKGYAAQAKVRNEHGQDLYVMVEPTDEHIVFESGERVLLNTQIAGNRFTAIVNPHPDLI